MVASTSQLSVSQTASCTTTDFQKPRLMDAVYCSSDVTERLPGLAYLYAAEMSPFTNASQRACALSFTTSEAGRLSSVAHAATATTIPIKATLRSRTLNTFKTPAVTGLCVESLFKLIPRVNQIVEIFATVCGFCNTIPLSY